MKTALLAIVFLAGCSQSDKSGAATPDSPDASADGGTCSPSVFSDSMRSQRDACTFAAGAKPVDTLGARSPLPIKHVIVLMKENRSFDHLLGQLSASGQPDSEPVPAAWRSLDKAGNPVAPSHATTTCVKADPPHQWDDMHSQVNGGKMDGFVKSGANSKPATDGTFTMGYVDASDIPFYYWLASTFSLADHYFPSVQSGTWANRDYLVAATSNGIKNTGTTLGVGQLDGVPIIFDRLEAAGISWNVYTDDAGPLEFSVSWGSRKQWGSVADFLNALKDGTLPSVAFLDATTAITPPALDEHPPSDVQAGEAWTRTIYNAVVASQLWPETALFFTYDEAGGFADHVPPPKSCAPSPDQSEFTELGIRVPLIVVSPWARRHHVSHLVHEHTSILRFIELLFDVPALTARDANSDALLDMFDFACRDLTPLPDPPTAGVGRCP